MEKSEKGEDFFILLVGFIRLMLEALPPCAL